MAPPTNGFHVGGRLRRRGRPTAGVRRLGLSRRYEPFRQRQPLRQHRHLLVFFNKGDSKVGDTLARQHCRHGRLRKRRFNHRSVCGGALHRRLHASDEGVRDGGCDRVGGDLGHVRKD